MVTFYSDDNYSVELIYVNAHYERLTFWLGKGWAIKECGKYWLELKLQRLPNNPSVRHEISSKI